MRNIFAVLLLLISSLSFAQDTLYYDAKWKKIQFSQPYEYYRIIYKDLADSNKVLTKTYFKSGQIQAETNYSKYSGEKRNGVHRIWYKDGQLKSEANYTGNLLDGKVQTFWSDGKVKRNDKYDLATLVEGHTYDMSGNTVKHYDYEVMPEFVNGYKEYLAYNIIYPAEEAKRGIQGKVYIQFTVDTRGRVTDVEIRKSVSPGLDREALRVIENMPRWKPAILDGEVIPLTMIMPVNFKLK